jgi:hypothetical protein
MSLPSLAAALVAATTVGCLRAPAYRCATSGDCVRGGAQGSCEDTGYCAFGDPACASGRRYDDSAASYAGTCVGATLSDGGVDASPDASATCGAERRPACHVAGGTTRPCDPVMFSAENQSFTLGMAVVGDYLFYAGGDGDIHRIRYDGLADTSIDGAGKDSVGLTTDGTHVYWGDYYDGVVRAAPVTPPLTPYDVTTLPSPASFGRLAVSGGEVFVNAPDGVWMAKANGTQATPSKVASKAEAGDEDKSSGIAADATHVYWTDNGRVRRIPIAQAGNETQIQDVAMAASADNVAVDDTRVYWTSTEGLSWRNKADLTGLTTIPVGDSKARGLLLDGDYVYTDTPDGRILRVKKGGAAADLEVVAHGVANPYELAASCGAVYWGTFTFGNYGTIYEVAKP